MDNKRMKEVVEKMVHLKSLANNPGTPEEAASAIAALQRMMDKHRVTEFDLEEAGRIERGEPIEDGYDVGSSASWKRLIFRTLAKTNGCVVLEFAKTNVVSIFGKESGIAITKSMYEYLITVIDNLANKAWSEAVETYYYPGSARSWKHSFRVGASTTVSKRLREEFENRRKGSEVLSSIMVVEDADANNLMNSLYNVRKHKVKVNTSSTAGLIAGRAAGASINLDHQVQSGSSSAKAIKSGR